MGLLDRPQGSLRPRDKTDGRGFANNVPAEEDGIDGGGGGGELAGPDGGFRLDCRNDSQCPAGSRCINGTCVSQDRPDAGCPAEASNNGGTFEGCPCGTKFPLPASGNCPSGYVPLKNADGSYESSTVGNYSGKICACQAYCGAIGRDPTSCVAGAGGGQAQGGEFKWSPDVQALLKRLLGRANELFDQPRGLSEQERQAVYNRAFEQIKAQERPNIQSTIDSASRLGLVDSPYATRQVDDVRRASENLMAQTARDISINENERRYGELMGTLGMISNLTNLGMSSEQIAEALSSARRGEGRDDMAMLLQYLGSISGGNNNYWQLLMSYILGGGKAA